MILSLILHFIKERRFWLLFSLVCCSSHAIAQYDSPQNRIWAFGDKAGLDFNTGNPVPIQTEMYILEGCASICDTNGQLLFYTNGTTIWNRNHTVMPNGSNLCGNPNIYATNSTTQSSLIVPVFNNPKKYYLFTLSDANDAPHYGRLAYSIVDMNLSNGMGDVITNNKAIPLDSVLSEKLIAIQGDQCNIWILVHAYDSNIFKAYELTGAGINPTPIISVTGNLNPPAYYYGGVMKGSPNRKWIMACTYGGPGATGNAELFHFDPGTGLVSNFAVLDGNGFNAYYGAAFSPDNSRLYITGQTSSIFQYDLTLGNSNAIINSKTDITVNAPVAGLIQGDLKLGPDGKIYIAEYAAPFLGVIDQPNLPGNTCNYTPNQIALYPNTSALFGLPNNIITLQQPVASNTATSICYFSDSTSFSIDTSAWDIIWDNGSTDTSRPVFHEGSYWVNYYTPPCLYHTDTFVLHTPTLMPHTGFTSSGCKGMHQGSAWAAPVAGDSSIYTYTWKDASGAILRISTHAITGDTISDLGPGNYTLHLEANGCDTFFTFELPAPDYKAAFTTDSLACAGDTLFFQNTSTGTFASWVWDFDDGTFSGALQTVHSYSIPGIYTVYLTGETTSGCTDTATKVITVDQRFDGHFIMDQDEICTGRKIVFSPQTDSSAIQLAWVFGDGTEVQTPNEIVQHAYDHDGIMPVQLHTRFRTCPDAITWDTVTIYPLPLVNLGPDTALCLDGAPILITNRALQPTTFKSLWNTGDTSKSILVRHPGIFSLQITSEHGCIATESVQVSRDCYIDVPNAFSPNEDGVNDYFFPRQLLSKNCTRFRMQIFNRWGQMIFETNQTNGRGWDGKFNNILQPPGVYLYIIESEIAGLRPEKYQGNVTLMR